MTNDMKIAIIGKGNVGTHLANAFCQRGFDARLIDSRKLEGIDKTFDFILISVSDDAIKDVTSSLSIVLKDYEGIIAHTAGSVSIDVLKPFFKKVGVFYPMQTFSKASPEMQYSEIPFFIEGNSLEVEQSLYQLALSISEKVWKLDSPSRSNLHIASVFACNFVNALFSISSDILERINLPFDILLPLIDQTVKKVALISPAEAQTGPARRGDRKVITSHLEQLGGDPKLKNIYEIMSEFLLNKYHSEQNLDTEENQ